MKKILYSIISVILLFLGSACEKDNNVIRPTASVTVINAAVNNGSIRVNAGAGSGFAYAKATDVAYGTSAVYGAFTGSNTITAVSSTDSTKVLFNRTIDLTPISTLYIAGLSPTIDTIFRVENNLPYINASSTTPDNSVYVRLVNLSPNSGPLNVNLSTTPTVNEVAALPYKGISEFKKYAAPTTLASYIFEIREPGTNRLIVSYTLPLGTYRFKTVTLVIRGLNTVPATTGANAFAVFPVSHT